LTVSDLSERDLIARVRSRLPPPPPWLVVGIGDDAAVIEPERNRLDVLSVDAMVDQVHFDRRFTPPDAIGYRALAVNVSDLAAMGASPRFALLSMALRLRSRSTTSTRSSPGSCAEPAATASMSWGETSPVPLDRWSSM
jgi:thiamine monophosphate kinase